jgi:hypothetical protein
LALKVTVSLILGEGGVKLIGEIEMKLAALTIPGVKGLRGDRRPTNTMKIVTNILKILFLFLGETMSARADHHPSTTDCL